MILKTWYIWVTHQLKPWKEALMQTWTHKEKENTARKLRKQFAKQKKPLNLGRKKEKIGSVQEWCNSYNDFSHLQWDNALNRVQSETPNGWLKIAALKHSVFCFLLFFFLQSCTGSHHTSNAKRELGQTLLLGWKIQKKKRERETNNWCGFSGAPNTEAITSECCIISVTATQPFTSKLLRKCDALCAISHQATPGLEIIKVNQSFR